MSADKTTLIRWLMLSTIASDPGHLREPWHAQCNFMAHWTSKEACHFCAKFGAHYD